MGYSDEVEVFVPYNQRWVAGFEVAAAESAADGERRYRVRRRSDGTELPEPMPADRIRPAYSPPPGRG